MRPAGCAQGINPHSFFNPLYAFVGSAEPSQKLASLRHDTRVIRVHGERQFTVGLRLVEPPALHANLAEEPMALDVVFV